MRRWALALLLVAGCGPSEKGPWPTGTKLIVVARGDDHDATIRRPTASGDAIDWVTSGTEAIVLEDDPGKELKVVFKEGRYQGPAKIARYLVRPLR